MNISLAESTLPHTEPPRRWCDYFTSRQWILFGATILVGVLFRWIGLGDRPYHHDESLHGMYGRYFYDFPDQNYYRYDPMLHGPFLYNLLRIVYSTVGYSDYGARAPIALIGTIFLLLPFLFRRYFTPVSTLTLTAVVSLSPTLIYWSRFLREDFGVISSLLLVLYGVLLAPTKVKSLCVFLGLFLMFSMKANFYVYVAMLAGYFVYETLFYAVRDGTFVGQIRERSRSIIKRSVHEAERFSVGQTFFLSALAVVATIAGMWAVGTLERATAVQSSLLVLALPVSFHLGEFLLKTFVFGLRNRPRWPFVMVGGFVAINFIAIWSSYDSQTGVSVANAPGFFITAFIVVMVAVAGYVLWEYLRYVAPKLPAGSIRATAEHIVTNWSYVAIAILVGATASIYLYSAGFRHDVFQLVQNQNTGPCPYPAAPGQSQLWSTFVCAILGYKPPSIIYGFYYWLHHHNIERIQGPFMFHFYVLSWYETLFILAYFYHLWCFYRTSHRGIRWAGIGILALTACALAFNFTHNFTDPNDKNIWDFFKLKDQYDLSGLFILLLHPILVTTEHLRKNQRGLAFMGYFFTTNFFTYSYLGEKVPWLSMYILVPGLIYLTMYFQQHFREFPLRLQHIAWSALLGRLGFVLVLLGLIFILQEPTPLFSKQQPMSVEQSYNVTFVGFGIAFLTLSIFSSLTQWLGSVRIATLLVVIGVAWNLRTSVLVNFVFPGEAREYLSQVHTTPEFRDLMWQLRAENSSQILGYKPTILITGDAVWPSTWYLRDIPEYKFSANPSERATFKYIIQDWKEIPENVPEGFIATRLNLRGWWVPDFNQMTLKKFLNYALNKTPWNTPGYTYVHLLVNTRK